MKKYLLLFASAALLLVGCAKEKFAEPIDGGLTNVTFTANVDGGVATKAFDDNDGNGTYVNRCIMEIYFQDQLYKRMEAAMSGNPATTTFANVPVVAGKEYQILFWADCGGEELADKYYTTETEEDNMGLKAVTVNQTAFLAALAAGDNDELDAFFFAGNYTVPQNPTQPFNVSLKRPFAQLNVITTDVAAGKTVTSEALLPEKVSVSYEAANTINVATGEISSVGEVEDYTFAYEADVYGAWSTITTQHPELTLSMDYILAPATEQGLVNVTFITKNDGQAVMTHSLTNLPYKRNYRTNVKGDLLTANGSWTATIAPAWTTPAYDVPFYVATSIQDAQEYIGTSSEQVKSKAVDLSKAAISQDDVKSDGTIHFILKTTSPKDLVNFTLPAIPETIQDCEGWTIEYEPQYPTENVGVNAPEGTKVKILAPTSHVNVTGTSYTEITALTGDNTLVIPQGVTVAGLIIQKGAVEIHGTVTNLSVNPASIADNPVQYEKVVFRACEGLSADVFEAIKGEDHDYIDPRYCAVEKATNPKTYDIVLATVATIGEKEYVTLAAAVAAVKNGETITLIKDVVLDKPIETNKTFTLTLNANITPVSGWQTNGNTDALVIINRGGNITINGTGKISSNGIANAYAAVKLTNKGENEKGAAAKLTVDGGVTLEGYYYGICGNGSRHNTEITVNGGTINGMAANDNVGIYHPQSGTLTINGGTIKGSTGIALKGGKLVVNGGKIVGNGEKLDFSHNGSGWNNTGDALAVEVCDYPGQNPPQNDLSVEIKGGEFSSGNAEAVASYAQPGKDYTPLKGFISGGTFSSDPWKYCAKGYASIEQGGNWIIVPAPKADVVRVYPDPDFSNVPQTILDNIEVPFYQVKETIDNIPVPEVEDGRILLSTDQQNGVYALEDIIFGSPYATLNGLDVCYIFAAREDDGTNGDFNEWNADFVISLDRTVQKDEIGLWGSYSGFLSRAFTAPSEIPANTEVPLLGTMTTGGISNFTYSMIKSDVKVFPCGAFKLSDSVKGATMKVDLRIYDPNNSEKYFVIESYEYKFTNETNAVIQSTN